MKNFKKSLLACTLLLGLSSGANASAVIGSTDLMTHDFHGQLEGLMNIGAVDFTNIFDKQVGDDAYDWHAAVDNQGATVTLMELVSNIDSSKTVVGLYSKLSWKSDASYTSSYDAFLVNLTTGEAFMPSGAYLGYGIYRKADYGPTVGAGHDFHLNLNLTTGYANPGYAYGSTYDPYALAGSGGQTNWQVAAMETFTIAEANVALDGTGHAGAGGGAADVSAPMALGGLALFGLGFMRRRK